MTAASAAGSAGANSGGAATAAANPLGIIATVAAAVAVSVGVLVSAPMMQAPPEAPPVVSAEYEIAFSGGTAENGHINPSKAEARAYTPERGEMIASQWRISTPDEGIVLYSGDGGIVGDTFVKMKTDGEYGEFILSFDMIDSAGDSWTLSREFSII